MCSHDLLALTLLGTAALSCNRCDRLIPREPAPAPAPACALACYVLAPPDMKKLQMSH